MGTVEIKLKDTLQKPFCVEAKDGEVIFQMVHDVLQKDKVSILSFDGIELVVAAFLNAAIGPLFCEYEKEYIESHVVAKDLHEDYNSLWNHTMHHAPIYYANKEVIDQHVSTIIDD